MVSRFNGINYPGKKGGYWLDAVSLLSWFIVFFQHNLSSKLYFIVLIYFHATTFGKSVFIIYIRLA